MKAGKNRDAFMYRVSRKDPGMLAQVTAKNVHDPFFDTH